MKKVREALLQTGIDDFLNEVAKKGEIRAIDLARQLDIPLETIESWAEILAKEKLVTTSYDKGGKLMIATTPQNVEDKQEFVKEMASDVEEKISSVHDSFKEREKALKKEYEKLKELESVLQKDVNVVAGLEGRLKQLTALEEQVRQNVAKILAEEESAVKESKTVSGLIDKKLKEVVKIRREIEQFNKAKERLKDDIKIIKRLSWSMKWTPASKMAAKIEEAEKRANEVKSLSEVLGSKYKAIQKMFGKL